MKLTGPFRIEITGNMADVNACPRDTRQIAYVMERLLTGEDVAVEELTSWGIVVRQLERIPAEEWKDVPSVGH